MDKLKKFYQKNKQILLYIVFGILTTVVNFVVYTPLTALVGADTPVVGIPWYLYTTVISWIAAVLFAYFTNKLFVFEQKSFRANIVVREMLSFFGARVATLLIEMAVMWLMISVIHADLWGIVVWATGLINRILGWNVMGDFIIKAGAQVIVIILNYIFSKLFVFREEKKENV